MNPSRLLFSFGFSAVLLLSGCEREEIRVYTAAKDAPVPDAGGTHHANDGHDHGDAHGAPGTNVAPADRSGPAVSWALPAGWKEVPAGKVNLAQFVIATPVGEANVSITPLPNLAGRESTVINMWRSQVGQGPLEESAVAAALTPAEVAGAKGHLFEVSGTREGVTTEIVTAMLHRPDASWFFKLSGNQAAMPALKPVFLEFLKSVRLGDSKSSGAAPVQP